MGQSVILGREALLAPSQSLKRKLVEIPSLGGSIWLREISGRGLLEYRERLEKLSKDSPEMNAGNSLELMALLVAKTACDEDGKLLYTEADVQALADNGLDLLLTLTGEAMALSGLPSETIKEVADNLKNASPGSSS
jgi:hypothetical protein